MSLIPRFAGSVALPTLRLAVLGVLATLVLAGVFAAVKALIGDDDDTTPPGVVATEVELEAGDGAATVGRTIDVPDGAETFILTARPGERYGLRARSGDDWHPWISVEISPHEAPDRPATARRPGSSPSSASSEGTAPELLAAGPLLVEDGVTQLELVRLADHDHASADAHDNGGTVGTTFLLDSYGADGPALGSETAVVAGTQVERGAAVDLTAQSGPPAQPAVMPRASWTSEGWASGNAGCEGGPRYAGNVQALVVHHTVTGNEYGQNEVDNLLRSIHYAHVHINGWCDIGYNFVVDRFGTIWEGRTGGADRPVIGGHARGFNTSTTGVALLGQFHPGASPEVARPSSEAAAAVQALAAWKLGLHGVDPAGTTWLRNQSSSGEQKLEGGAWHLVPTVLVHRDLGFTSCPGDYGVEVAHGMVPSLVSSRPSVPPYRFDGWEPNDDGPGLITLDGRGGLRPAGSVAVAGIGAPVTGPQPLPPPAPVAVAANRYGLTAVGYVLAADGTLHPFGGAPAVGTRPAGDRAVIDLAVAADGRGGWVIAGDGTVHPFGGASNPVAGSPDATAGGGTVIAGALDGAGNGYLVDASGGLRPVGAAPGHQLTAGQVEAVDVAVRPGSAGGWVLDASGRLHPFGGAPAVALATPTGPAPGRQYQAVMASPTGQDGWVMTDDGQLWPFGGAPLVRPVATDASARDLLDAATVSPAMPEDFLASDAGRYTAAILEIFWGRPGTEAEIIEWGRQLYNSGGRLGVTLALAQSDQWAGAKLDALYSDVLGRGPDEDGRRYWLDQMRDGLPLAAVGAFLYGSDEYYQASPSASHYVTRLYAALLGRQPDPDGLDYWSGLIDSDQARPLDVAAGFYASVESRHQRVRDVYQSVLGREPDPSGLTFWTDELLRSDDVMLAAHLAASDELYQRVVTG